jgi:hypothetical protein
MRRSQILAIALGCFTISTSANAAVFSVDAHNNSSTGGSGLSTISLTSGQAFTVTAGYNDLWSIGDLPRFANADGLIAPRFATAADDSGQPIGTLIGNTFVPWTQAGLTAPYASLVGEIGGVFKFIGTNFSSSAWNTGTLDLYAWDENNGDNVGTILANVNIPAVGGAVTEPATWSMIILGMGGLGAALRRRRNRASLRSLAA